MNFYNCETDRPISVTVTFVELNTAEKEKFKAYLDGDSLSITKEANWGGISGLARYYGSRLQHKDFQEIRKASTATERKNQYNQLIETGKYSGLVKVTKGGDVDEQLLRWEETNPGLCERQRDDGQFFGFPNVGYGRIDQFSRWLFIPAVHDAADEAVENRGNTLKNLIDLVLRPKLNDLPALKELKEEASRRYREILNPESMDELKTISTGLTQKLEKFAPGTDVRLGWQNLENVNLPLPSARTLLGEGDFEMPVDRAGHGTQRAFLIAILQYLADVRIGMQEGEKVAPHIILGIEEPELYLHPIRARLMNLVLRELSRTQDGRPAIQSVYATHSPYFADIGFFTSIRRVRREPHTDPAKPGVTKARLASLGEIARLLAEVHRIDPATYTAERLMPRLLSVMTPIVSEGFFSDRVVLVEGEEDRAALFGIAKQMDKSFEKEGVSVIPVCGKTNLDRPYLIFKSLGIQCYLIFDGDKNEGKQRDKRHPQKNRALLRLLGKPEEDYPHTVCWPEGACFQVNLQDEIRRQIGPDVYSKVMAEVLAEFDLEKQADGERIRASWPRS